VVALVWRGDFSQLGLIDEVRLMSADGVGGSVFGRPDVHEFAEITLQ
jgi:hypothetical protein